MPPYTEEGKHFTLMGDFPSSHRGSVCHNNKQVLDKEQTSILNLITC